MRDAGRHLPAGGADPNAVKVEPIDWPVKVQLLIDNGTGMDAALVQIRNGVKGFVEAP